MAGKKPRKPPTAPSVDSPLRIIGGRFRGRPITYHGQRLTRPMKQRVRESVFNLLGPAVEAKHAVDLFAGTGALGLEAISRGASGATFVERHFPTAKVIRENIRSLGLEEVTEVVAADVFIWVRQQLANLAREPLVVFCAPPYALFTERRDDMLEMIDTIQRRAPAGSILVVESDDKFDVTQLPGAKWDTRVYPPAQISILLDIGQSSN